MKRLAALWFFTCSALLAQGTLSLEQISADQGIWPREVMVVVDHKLPVTENGKTRWRKVGPGKMYTVVSINAKGVTIDGLGTPLTFQADETDLVPRAEQLKAQRDAPPPPPVPAATPIDPPNSGPRLVAIDSAPGAPSAPASRPSAAAGNVMARLLDGMLVRMDNGSLAPYDARNLGNKKFVAVYFSASWCGPCRKFTPAFVDWYKRAKSFSDDFEVVFVSRDRDELSMKNYMANDRMEWPAVSFARGQNNPLLKYAGNGIPCLVILDGSGSVVSHSYDGEQYLGPVKPLQDLAALLSGKGS